MWHEKLYWKKKDKEVTISVTNVCIKCTVFSLFLNHHYVREQDKRISVIDALAHPYLDEGRLRYHSCMCKCCFTTSSGMRQYTNDFEPAAAQPFDDLWERKLTSVQQVKGISFVWFSFCRSLTLALSVYWFLAIISKNEIIIIIFWAKIKHI